jgi:UPF0755 protein
VTVRRGRERGTMARRPDDLRSVRSRREIGVRGGEFQPRERRRGRGGWGWLLVAIAAVAFVVLILPMLFGAVLRDMAESNPDLLRLPFFADAVRDGMDERLDRPAGTDNTPVTFTVAQGTSAREITDELVARGLVTDRLAFAYLLIVEGHGSSLMAGSHTLDRTMSPRQVVQALQAQPIPTPVRLSVQFRPGLRIEQYAAQLVDEQDRLEIDPAVFRDLAIHPSAELRADFPMLASLPEGHSLEGFLSSGVFELPPGTDAEGLLRALLQRRQDEIGTFVDHALPTQLASFYEAMILASIVEAEATLAEEKPVIAGVFLNRLDRSKWPTRLLDADPTVIYGNDTVALRNLPLGEWNTYVFWSPPGVPMRAVELPADLFGFHSYRSRGLPPGPIRSPTASSILAVLEPDTQSGYLFFVAKADGSHSHAFARTLEEHQQNIDRYVRGRSSPSPAP